MPGLYSSLAITNLHAIFSCVVQAAALDATILALKVCESPNFLKINGNHSFQPLHGVQRQVGGLWSLRSKSYHA